MMQLLTTSRPTLQTDFSWSKDWLIVLEAAAYLPADMNSAIEAVLAESLLELQYIFH